MGFALVLANFGFWAGLHFLKNANTNGDLQVISHSNLRLIGMEPIKYKQVFARFFF